MVRMGLEWLDLSMVLEWDLAMVMEWDLPMVGVALVNG